MNITNTECGCGNSTTTSSSTTVSSPCTCGCCGPATTTKGQKLEELRALRATVDQQLAQLEEA